MTTSDGLWRFPVTYEGLPQEQPFLVDAAGDTLDNDLILAETAQTLALTVTLQQYTDLLSAALNGANRKFGERYIDVIYPLIKAGKNLAGNMTCEDVADCIETNEATIAALIQQLSAQGYSPNGNSANNSSTNVTMSPSQSADNLLPDGYTCSNAQLMATARGVVKQLDEASEDFFDSVEFVTNPIEAANIITDGVPVAGTVNNLSELADWLVQTMRESYSASYNQEVEDTLACDLYCRMVDECELTYDMALAMYESFASSEYGLPTNVDDFQSIVDWATGLSLAVSVGTVATFHYMLLLAMRFGDGTVFEFAGLTSLKSLIAMTIGWNDTTWEDCACATPETPQTFWYMDLDFNISKFGTLVPTTPVTAAVWTGDGYETRTSNSNARAFIGKTFGDTALWLAGIRITSQRRGSDGNGTNDYKRMLIYPNADWTGTQTDVFTANFITCNDNDCQQEQLGYLDNQYSFKSAYFVESVNGAYAALTNFAKVYRIEIWGWNHGDYKPDGSVWVSSRV